MKEIIYKAEDKHGIRHPAQAMVNTTYHYAVEAHKGVFRKYTGEEYITHPVAVAKIVRSVTDDLDTILAAILHDVIEDTDITDWGLLDFGFSAETVYLVQEVTNPSKKEDGPRKLRKAMDKAKLSLASDEAQTIKLADIIHNLSTIDLAHSDWAKMYLSEKKSLLPVLVGGDETLMKKAVEMVEHLEKFYAVL